MSRKIRRIAVLTGGGDCPGLNAVIRAIAKTAITRYGWEVVGFRDGYRGLVEDDARALGYEDVSNILTQGGTILGTSNKDDPFRYVVATEPRVVRKDMSRRAIGNLRNRRCDALVCIGGDGTLTIAHQLVGAGVRIVGVPKTIDNDVRGTDRTFGYDTAMSTAAEAIDRIHTTAASHHRAMVVEVMGRYAGWLALGAGVAAGGDIILIPEILFDFDAVCRRVVERSRCGKRFSIVVVAEGAHPRGGNRVVRKVDPTSPDPIRLGGIGGLVARTIEERTGIESRTTVLGHIQRGGTPTPFDRVLATGYGTAAADALAEGRFGTMVALRGREIRPVALDRVAGKPRRIPKSFPLLRAARSVGTSFGDETSAS